MLPDYYSILAVRPDASPEEIRAAYRRLVKLDRQSNNRRLLHAG